MIMETGLLIYIAGLVIFIFIAGFLYKKSQDAMASGIDIAMALLWPVALPMIVVFVLLKMTYSAGMWAAEYFKNKGE
jgi:uncharacterized membrane protein